MKKIIYLFLMILTPIIANANLSSVSNVHNQIYSQKVVTVPIESGVDGTNISSAKYLFRQIDKANEILNGYASTDYNNSAESTTNLVAESKVESAVEELVVKLPEFSIIVNDVDSFDFQISAAGNFTVNWGDGTTTDVITKSDTTNVTYSHTYATTGNYIIYFEGDATAYNSDINTAAITFYNSTNKTKIIGMNGSLGKIFPAIDGTGPRFARLFQGCTGLTSIPDNLFSGITGTSVNMFWASFYGCYNLTSISENLFSGMSGDLSESMFASTFSSCVGLTSLPAGLFSNISGNVNSLFYGTFSNCTSLTSLPAGLFSNISGTANYLFASTFSGCSGLISIPATLFSGVTGAPKPNVFYGTFSGCTGLTSIPAGLFSGVVGAPADSMFYFTFQGCTGLISLPVDLFSGVSGPAAPNMFNRTFNGCTHLTSIPSGLFGNISGAPASYMFYGTFYNCTSLTGSIPSGLFGSITGAPAERMFYETFFNCSGLTDISGGFENCEFTQGIASYSIFNTYRNCVAATSASPADKNGLKFYSWDNTTSYSYGTFMGDINLSDYASIPTMRK